MDVFDILDRLVAFPSVAGKSNGAIAGWIEAYLRQHGAKVTLLPGPEGD
ncbi:acetylornithine deacetylase, partial [Mesorhizobium sp. M00.F.Ca.ET.149.01.1.1]